ncbi:MAG: hypothetical protein HY360_16750 [Verrucomicrobia bacterium]|nr:hypothetical protein [Verrucomicrobiota bacterium]
MTWILFLSVVGIILICLELFLPGMVVGTMGAICLVAAVLLTYAQHGVAAGNMAFVALLVCSVVAVIVWLTIFPKTAAGKMLITSRDLRDSKTADPQDDLLGRIGKALSPLRPAGVAMFDQRRVDVVAESGLIEPECPVKVVLVEGSRVVVRKI